MHRAPRTTLGLSVRRGSTPMHKYTAVRKFPAKERNPAVANSQLVKLLYFGNEKLSRPRARVSKEPKERCAYAQTLTHTHNSARPRFQRHQ